MSRPRRTALAAASVAAVAAAFMAGCGSNAASPAHHVKHVHAEIYHATDGHDYACTPRRDDDTSTENFLIWWIIMGDNGTKPVYSGPTVSGGSWARVSGPAPSTSTLSPTGRTVTLDDKAEPTEQVESDQEVAAAGEATVESDTTEQEAQADEQAAEQPAEDPGADNGNNGDNGGSDGGDSGGGDSGGGDSGGGDAGGGE